MMTKLSCIFALLVVTATSSRAELFDVDISATRTKLDEQKERQGNVTVVSKDIAYKVSVESHTAKPLNGLVVKYMIFYVDPQLGVKEKAVTASHNGSHTIEALPPRGTLTFDTDPFKLTSEELDGGYYFASGASGRSQDRVLGIWFRAYMDGKMVGEYANPTTISKKNTWKD